MYKQGIYRHYKGNIYKVISLGIHSETLEEMVIYHPKEDPNKIWVRPLMMFFEKVNVNNEMVDRFQFLENG